MYIADNDKYIDHVMHNGIAVFQLVKDTLLHSASNRENIEQLAYKIAKERAETNMSIGEFVYNTNLGRRLVIKYALQSTLSIKELLPLIDEINCVFDQFLFYAVTKYSELKEAELREKTCLSPNPIRIA